MNRLNLIASQVALATAGAVSVTSNEVNIALEAMNLASADLNTGLDTIEELHGDAIALESYAELGQSFQGGMNSQSAVVMAQGANHLANRWGVEIESVGTESFDDNPTMATQVACEGIKDAAVALWEGFLDMLKKIRTATKDALAKYMNAGSKLKKQFEALEDKVDDLGEIKDGKDKVSGDFLKVMVISGKADADALIKFADGMDKEVNGAADAINASTKGMLALAGKSPEEHASTAASLFTIATDYKSQFSDNKQSKAFEKLFGGDKAAGKFKVMSVVAYPRDSYTVYAVNEAGVESVKYMAGVNLDAADKEISTLSGKDFDKWIAAGIKSSESLEASIKDWAKAEKAAADLISEVEKIGKKAKSTKDDEKEAAKGWKKIHRGLSGHAKNTQAIERGVSDSLKNTAQGIYGYVTASIGAYNKA